MRAYMLAEIDEMRDLVGVIMDGPGSYQYSGNGYYSSGRVYNESERSAKIEDRLRTYMTASLEPEELRARVKEIREIEQERMDRARESYERQQEAKRAQLEKPKQVRGFTWLNSGESSGY